MEKTLHITSGDIAGSVIAKSGIAGEVFVWHDIHYDGPGKPGWPGEEILLARAGFLEESTGGGLTRKFVFETLKNQYAKLQSADEYENIVLWFDACLFDQSMLCHILMCLHYLKIDAPELLCIDSYPGIDPYHGLGQLSPEQMASVYDRRQPVTAEQFLFAEHVDRAFALQDMEAFKKISALTDAPLPWVPAAVRRWMEEKPDSGTGLGRLEQTALEAVRSGCDTPMDVFAFVTERETPPQFWGDTTLWSKINSLADRNPPLARIEGPDNRLPQWDRIADLELFHIYPAEEPGFRDSYFHGYEPQGNRDKQSHIPAPNLYDAEVKAYGSYLHDVVFGMSFEYVRAGERLLDIGIGTGLSSRRFAEMGLKIYGLDISKEMLEICRSKSFTEELVRCDITREALPFSNRFFNHVVCCGALHFLGDLDRLFREAIRTLKTRGIFAFTIAPNETDAAYLKEPTPWGIPIFRHSPSYVYELLEANNLKLLKEQRLLIKGADKEHYNMLFSSLICRHQ